MKNDFNELTDYCDKYGKKLMNDANNYYFRFETRNNWERYFSTVFEITDRKMDKWELVHTQGLAEYAKKHGISRAFYHFVWSMAKEEYPENSIQYQWLNYRMGVLEKGYYRTSNNLYTFALIARYSSLAPALSDPLNTKTFDISSHNCPVILPNPCNVFIEDQYIEILFNGEWLPKNSDTGQLIDAVINELLNKQILAHRGRLENIDLSEIKAILSTGI
jgi:hypothetical protein